MKKWFEIFDAILVLFLMVFTSNVVTGNQEILYDTLSESLNNARVNDVSMVKKQEIARHIKGIQIPFIANNGQIDGQVKFYAHTFGGTVFVTREGEIVYALPNNISEVKVKSLKSDGRRQRSEARRQMSVNRCEKSGSNPKSAIQNLSSTSIGELKSGVTLKEEFVGAKIEAIQGEEKSVTKVNYFKGNDPSKWKSNVSTCDMVNLGEIYKGIDLKLRAYGNNIEKLFTVKPDADPETIRLRLSGTKALKVNKEGELEVRTDLGTVRFTRPVAYQEVDGKRVEVPVKYRMQKQEIEDKRNKAEVKGGIGERNRKVQNAKCKNLKSKIINRKLEYGFTVASYDKTKDLIIDPLLASTYLGGDSYDYAYSAAIDKDGNVYVAGYTYSNDFPTTPGAYNTSHNGGSYDVFVSRFDGDLTTLLASTYLGGGSEDIAHSVTIDKDGNIYVTGVTGSSDFPTTLGAYDTSYSGGAYGYLRGYDEDVFVSRFNGDLTKLLASTYLEGNTTPYPLESGSWDCAYSIAIDKDGNIYVAGETNSVDFPTTPGAYDTSFNTGEYTNYDAFVSKFNEDLTKLLASTYLGGTDSDEAYSVAIDRDGNIYVAGGTRSDDFPTTSGAYDTSYSAAGDVFVSKFNGDLTTLLASTYLGGIYSENAESAAMDKDGNIYVTGYTISSDFPTTPGAYDTSFNGGLGDVFVSRFNGDLTRLLASTFLGGDDADEAHSVAIDKDGNIYVAGETESDDFPTTFPDAYDISYSAGDDVFVSRLNGDLTKLLASTYLGGTGNDEAYSAAIDIDGNIYVAGYTTTSYFPTTLGAYDTSFNGGGDVFVSRFDANLSYASATPTPTATTTPTPTQSCSSDGDVNEDSKLTAKDALLAFEYVLGKASLTPCQQTHADVNGNGKVTAADALCIFKAVLNGSSPSETLSCE